RAKNSTAFTSALKYFAAGTALLVDQPWERRHELMFSLELQRAECEFLTGQSEAAQGRLIVLSSNVATTSNWRRLRVCELICTPLSIKAIEQLLYSWSTSNISVSIGLSVPGKTKHDENTIGFGCSWVPARSRNSSSCLS